MNQSRGVISAETVASTNEPLNQFASASASATATEATVNIISKSIHHQQQQHYHSSSTSLPTMLARSLVVALTSSSSSSNSNTNDGEQSPHQQLALTSTTATAAGKQLQQEQSFSDWWSEYWSRQPFPSGYTQSSITLLACLITTIIFLIVVGNLLVCIAIFTEKSLKPTQNWFIASLAVSDMLLGLVVMPFSLARELMGFWIFGPLWCDIHEAIDVLLTTASINTLCLISLDRYWSITQAVSYLKKRTPRRGALMIAFVWIFSAAVSLPPLFGWKKQSPSIIANASSSSFQRQQPVSTTTLASVVTSTWNDQPADDEEPESRARRHNNAQQQQQQQQLPFQTTSSRQELATPHLVGRRRAFDDPSRLSKSDQLDTMQPLIIRSLQFDAHHRDQLFPQQQQQDAMQPFLSALGTTADPDQFADGDGVLTLVTNSPSAQQLQPTSSSSTVTSVDSSSFTTEYPSCQLSDEVGYVIYSALGSFFIPCAVMVFTYIKIFLAARSRARRAINKQSRAGQSALNGAKRGQGRRGMASTATSAATVRGAGKVMLGDASGVPQVGPASPAAAFAVPDSQQHQNESKPMEQPMMKGKIVIVERRKSMAASSLAAQPTAADNQSCLPSSGTKNTAGSHLQTTSGDNTYNDANLCKAIDDGGATTCTLTTSGAKQASPSALNTRTQDASQLVETKLNTCNDSSLITVMNASMSEVPVTRFNFRQPSDGAAAAVTAAPKDHADQQRAAALLQAISQVGKNADNELLKEVLSITDGEQEEEKVDSSTKPPPDIIVDERRSTIGSSTAAAAAAAAATPREDDGKLLLSATTATDSDNDDQCPHSPASTCLTEPTQSDCVGVGVDNTTKETCFMTIEEDSDMFDAQAGRTIVMVAGNAANQCRQTKNHHHSGTMMTMMPPVSQAQAQAQVCNSALCRLRQHPTSGAPRSGSSYCGSSMTINDDDLDDCVDDELLTDDCNGYSVTCGLDQYCPGASTCPHCQECEQAERQQQQQQQQRQQNTQQVSPTSQSTNRQLSLSDSSPIVVAASRRPQSAAATTTTTTTILPASKCISNDMIEAQSMMGDDNLSMTEYRSNEDENSSIVGHDMLDATEVHHHHKADKKKSNAAASSNRPNTERKKSSIGFRLARLGSSAPLTGQSGGLLALASDQQHSTGGTTTATGGGRNLKALRQNFLLKLNQLTAKSVSKPQDKNKKLAQMSSSGKTASAQSSGTSYEPSVDCATTSQVHSNEYPPETTAGEPYDYENQVSSESQGKSHSRFGQQQREGVDDLVNGPAHRRKHEGEDTLVADGNDRNNNNNNNEELVSAGQRSGCSQSAVNGKNNQILDKNDDDRALLLRSPQLTDQSNKSRLLNTGNATGSTTINAINRKSQRFDDNNQQSHHHTASGHKKQAGVITSTSGQTMNRSSTALSSSLGGTGNSGANRAYLAADNERHKRKLAKARERRATLILGLIMAAFIWSWLPFFTFYVLRAVCIPCRDYMPPRLEAFIFWMGYCNSAINPIIYTIFNRDFRKAFRKILFKCL